LAYNATLEQSLASVVEGSVKKSKENSSVFGKNLSGLVIQWAEDGDVLEDDFGLVGRWRGHCDCLSVFDGSVCV
jgi:hypothetical protein